MLTMKGMRFPKEIILVCIRWYAAYALSYRDPEEMMQGRGVGVGVDHSAIGHWAIRFLPLLEKVLRQRKRPVGSSWRLDETYIKVGVSGNTCTGRLTSKGTPLIFCSEPSAIQ